MQDKYQNTIDEMRQSVSIIIPALNEEHYICYCLESISKLNTENIDVEVIVVDNGSTDNTVGVARLYGSKVLIKKDGTIASLRNYGAQHSKGQILAFLDADCIAPHDWLSTAFPYFRKEYCSVLGFKLVIPEKANWVAKCWDLLFSRRYATSEVEWIPSGNMMMNKDEFISVGGFSESLATNEDYDLCFRLKRNGCNIISSSETSLIHLRPPQSLKQLFKKELWHGKEVFRVFLSDIVRNKDIQIHRRKNFKVVLYAAFYFINIVLMIFSVFLAMSGKSFVPLLFTIFLPITLSVVLSCKYIGTLKKINMIFGVSILLTIYGFARAMSLLLAVFKKELKYSEPSSNL